MHFITGGEDDQFDDIILLSNDPDEASPGALKDSADEGSSKADDPESEIDLEMELEKGLQEASTRMEQQENTPADSEENNINLIEQPKNDGAAVQDLSNPPDEAEAEGQEHMEDALLRAVQENGLTEVQVRKKEKEKQYAALLKTLHDKELDRYEAFRRSSLSRGKMRKLLMSISGQTINDEKVLIVVCSLAKMFVGELIEEAREMATMEAYEGPLLRAHIHHAYSLMEGEGHVKHRRVLKRFFKHI